MSNNDIEANLAMLLPGSPLGNIVNALRQLNESTQERLKHVLTEQATRELLVIITTLLESHNSGIGNSAGNNVKITAIIELCEEVRNHSLVAESPEINFMVLSILAEYCKALNRHDQALEAALACREAYNQLTSAQAANPGIQARMEVNKEIIARLAAP